MTRKQLLTKKIVVLMGGLSGEREVSLKTGNAALKALCEQGYNAVAIDVGNDLPAQLRQANAEVAFVALHGRFGEDGRVQGLLEMLQIPYTGSGVKASSIAIDKITTKHLLRYQQIDTPAFFALQSGEQCQPLPQDCNVFPLVVKPAREGSTLGISIAENAEQLQQGIALAFERDTSVLVEEFIDGVELTVSVLDGQPLPIIQIVPKSGFYDYAAKYVTGDTQYLLPAPLPQEQAQQIAETAVKAYRMLGCRGAARVDFMLQGERFTCLEVNTIPGMTETSLLPKAAAAAGIEFNQLVEMMLLDAALDK